jgi:hypothetical protein
LFVLGLFMAGSPGRAEEPSLPEYQVKALFVFNFAKYVDWPQTAFANDSAPITIGLLGENKLRAHLEKVVEGKTIAGRKVLVRQIEKDEDCAACQILFVSASEKRRTGEILDQGKDRPVLTVGETERFAEQGGMIGFIKKDGKVRLQINLEAARRAKLQLNSKLLSVADTIMGKP